MGRHSHHQLTVSALLVIYSALCASGCSTGSNGSTELDDFGSSPNADSSGGVSADDATAAGYADGAGRDGGFAWPDWGHPSSDSSSASNDSSTPIRGHWRSVSKGAFKMGSMPSEFCRYANEVRHEVSLTRGFEIWSTEVTQGEFYKTMGYNPSRFKACGASCPVETLSWNEAVAYCNALSSKASKASCYSCTGSGQTIRCKPKSSYAGAKIYQCPGYRLPTDAEWEYAYRANTTTPLYAGSIINCASSSVADAVGWHRGNAKSTTHAVARKKPNAWGLYDMAGNVFEWVHDWYKANLGKNPVTDPAGPATGSKRVLRGGSYLHRAGDMRASIRGESDPNLRFGFIGFRCVRTK